MITLTLLLGTAIVTAKIPGHHSMGPSPPPGQSITTLSSNSTTLTTYSTATKRTKRDTKRTKRDTKRTKRDTNRAKRDTNDTLTSRTTPPITGVNEPIAKNGGLGRRKLFDPDFWDDITCSTYFHSYADPIELDRLIYSCCEWDAFYGSFYYDIEDYSLCACYAIEAGLGADSDEYATYNCDVWSSYLITDCELVNEVIYEGECNYDCAEY